MAIDWNKSTNEQRRALYRVTREVARRHGLTLDDVYRQSFGIVFAHGEGYEDNFSSGRMARWRCGRIFDWLRRRHSAYAGLLMEELGAADKDAARASDWAEFLAEYGQFELLSCAHIEPEQEPEPEYEEEPDELEYSEDEDEDEDEDDEAEEEAYRAAQRSKPRTRIDTYTYSDDLIVQTRMRLGDPFRFFLNSPQKGVAIGLEWIEGDWFALPLHDRKPVAPLMEGDQALPFPDSNDPTANLLVEHGQHGLHRVVMLLLPETKGLTLAADLSISDPIPVSTLNEIAWEVLSLPGDGWRACRLNILFS